MTAEPPRRSPRLRSQRLNLRLGEFHWTHNDLTDGQSEGGAAFLVMQRFLEEGMRRLCVTRSRPRGI